MVEVSSKVEVKLLKWQEKGIPPGVGQGEEGFHVEQTASAKVLWQKGTEYLISLES